MTFLTPSFPLRYQDNAITFDSADYDKTRSQIKHLFNTIAGERKLNKKWGAPVELLYESDVPEVFIARLDIELRKVIPNNINFELIEIENDNGKLTLQLDLYSDEEVREIIQESLIQQFIGL